MNTSHEHKNANTDQAWSAFSLLHTVWPCVVGPGRVLGYTQCCLPFATTVGCDSRPSKTNFGDSGEWVHGL
jgi:hypothetical protein